MFNYFDGKRWRDYTEVHRIALKESLELIKNNRPKFMGKIHMFEAISEQKLVKLIIRYDRACNGYYMYVYNMDNNKCIADHLCDDLSQAFCIAKEDYGVSDNEFKNTD